MKTRVLFVERKRSPFISIEKVFRRVAQALPPGLFNTEFQQVPFANDLLSLIKNMVFFRPLTADIYHVTGHIHPISLLLPRRRTVLTVHDLGFLYTRKGLRRYMLKKLYLDWPVRRLKYLTTISEFTKSEILRYTGVAESRVRVIENPLGIDIPANKQSPFNHMKPTILQIGTTENKNIPTLVRAIAGLSCKLRIIGPVDDRTRQVIAETEVEVEYAEGLSDSEMTDEYRRADILAFCSTYEGFGLPIIEAQAMMVPVVTSNISPMMEVSGGAALLVDPKDITDIRSAIERLIADPRLRDQIVMQGTENIKRFDAVNIAKKYGALYLEMLETSRENED